MNEGEAYEMMQKFRLENKAFDRFISKVEFRIERFLAKQKQPGILDVKVKKLRPVNMSAEIKTTTNAYIAYKYVVHNKNVRGDDIYKLEPKKKFIYTVYWITSRFVTD